jgi:hypothetical protein
VQQHPRECQQVVSGGDQAGRSVAERRGRLQALSGGSDTTSPPGVGRYPVASRSVAVVKNAVSRIPSGARNRDRRTRASGSPAARASSTPSTEAPVL